MPGWSGSPTSLPEKDKVALVVKSDNSSAPKLGVLMEQAAQHASDPPTQPRIEVVEHQLGSMAASTTVTLRHRTGKYKCRRLSLVVFPRLWIVTNFWSIRLLWDRRLCWTDWITSDHRLEGKYQVAGLQQARSVALLLPTALHDGHVKGDAKPSWGSCVSRPHFET